MKTYKSLLRKLHVYKKSKKLVFILYNSKNSYFIELLYYLTLPANLLHEFTLTTLHKDKNPCYICIGP